jgi:hypothetical protein
MQGGSIYPKPGGSITRNRAAEQREAREAWLKYREQQEKGIDRGIDKGADLENNLGAERSHGLEGPEEDFSLQGGAACR